MIRKTGESGKSVGEANLVAIIQLLLKARTEFMAAVWSSPLQQQPFQQFDREIVKKRNGYQPQDGRENRYRIEIAACQDEDVTEAVIGSDEFGNDSADHGKSDRDLEPAEHAWKR